MPRPTHAKNGKRGRRRKVRRATAKRKCKFTRPGEDSPSREDLFVIDYKNLDVLARFTTSQGKLFSRKRSGNSAKAQAAMKAAIKHARYMALLPYVGGD
ncbi:MAG: 30S ribosomal protein S18 [Planctomycetota bacterium]